MTPTRNCASYLEYDLWRSDEETHRSPNPILDHKAQLTLRHRLVIETIVRWVRTIPTRFPRRITVILRRIEFICRWILLRYRFGRLRYLALSSGNFGDLIAALVPFSPVRSTGLKGGLDAMMRFRRPYAVRFSAMSAELVRRYL